VGADFVGPQKGDTQVGARQGVDGSRVPVVGIYRNLMIGRLCTPRRLAIFKPQEVVRASGCYRSQLRSSFSTMPCLDAATQVLL
jgi:hypothetical protein